MSVEFAAATGEQDSYPLPLTEIEIPAPTEAPAAVPEEVRGKTCLELDWRPLVLAILEDSRRGLDAGIIAARFHNSLIGAIVAVARAIGEDRVALTGGCFQNRLLSEGAAGQLRDAGFEVLLHHQVPPNDGGISLGQVAVAAARLREMDSPTG
jgi:hydrogenase maturation protein HypF